MVGGMQLYQHHSNSQNDSHDQGKMVHGDARSRAGESGNSDIPTSNIHIQNISVITLNEKRFTVKLTEISSILPLHVLLLYSVVLVNYNYKYPFSMALEL